MSYPIKICAICGEEFELKPGKPGFANHCPSCSADEATGDPAAKQRLAADPRQGTKEMNAERRKAIRDLLYRKDS